MKYYLILILLISHLSGWSQKYLSSESHIRFFSEAPLENIEAENVEARSVFDASTGDLVFSIPIESFDFEKKLMEEHFNENYLETEKYPKSTFKAKIVDWNKKEGLQEVTVEGTLSLHGIDKTISVTGNIDFSQQEVKIESTFVIQLKDYKIKIPKAVFYNIAEEVEVTVKFTYDPHEAN